MTLALNPEATEFTPSRVSPNATEHGGSLPLKPEAPEFVPNKSKLGAGSFEDIISTNFKSEREDFYGSQSLQLSPYYQWQPELPHQYYGHLVGLDSNLNNAGHHQEYEPVSYYPNGSHGKYKKKVKNRNFAKAYGYGGSRKHFRGNFNPFNDLHDQGQQLHRGFGNRVDISHQSGNGFSSQQNGVKNSTTNATVGQHDSLMTYLNTIQLTQTQPNNPDLYSQASWPDSQFEQEPVRINGEVSGSQPSTQRITIPQDIGKVSIDDQVVEVEELLVLSTSKARNALPLPHPSADSNDVPITNNTIEQQEGGVAAEHDFAMRVAHTRINGDYKPMSMIAKNMYEEVKNAYFPDNVERFKWARMTPKQIGFAERTHQLGEMGEAELAYQYDRILGSN